MIAHRNSLADFIMGIADPSGDPNAPSSHRARDVAWYVQHFVTQLSDSDVRQRTLPVLKGLCAKVWRLDDAKGLTVLPESSVLNLLTALVQAEDWEFLEESASHLGGKPPAKFFSWAAEEIAYGRIHLPHIEKRYDFFA